MMTKYGMQIVPIESGTYHEVEADSKEEAIAMGQEYANNNFCYTVQNDSVEEVK